MESSCAYLQQLNRSPLTIVQELASWRPPGGRVVDLGTGSGRHAIALAQQGYQVDAIDQSPGVIARLHAEAEARGLSIHARVMSVCSPDIDFSRYDVVICTLVLHFLAMGRATELLDRARVQARPGTLHAIAAFAARGHIFDASPGGFYFPEPGAIAEGYRASRWSVHRAYEEPRITISQHADGTRKRNLTSFVVASI